MAVGPILHIGNQLLTISIALDQDLCPSFETANRAELQGKEFDADTLRRLGKILEAILPTLTKQPKELTPLERRFLTAIHFYRKASFSYEAIDKVVNYVVALESMFVMRDERPSAILLKRIPEFLWVITNLDIIGRRIIVEGQVFLSLRDCVRQVLVE